MTLETGIAIVGVSGRFPGAKTATEFWENLEAGRESIKPKRDEFTDPLQAHNRSKGHWVGVNSLLTDVDRFDASFFGFSPREAWMIDPQHRLFLESAWEAIDDAGYKAGDIQRRVGVFAGASLSGYLFNHLSEDAHLLEALPVLIANDRDYLATRVSYKMNFSGPSVTVQCACSTSLVAVHLACQSLIAGECDAALAGGVSVSVPRVDRYYYLPGGILSPDGRCRAFDAKARGTAFAEGLGVVLLMRAEDALRDNHPIYAVIIGSALNNDGRSKAGYTAPSIEGQMRVISEAQAVAGIDPGTIGYVEGHGTGTILGDAIELAALTKVFRAATRQVGFCGLGSVKTNIGHVSTAAGVAGLIKTALALKHRVVPPSPNFVEPNPELEFSNSPFYINTKVVPWNSRDSNPRRAGVSSFGIGGTNAHVVLEEAPMARSSRSTRPWHMLPLSAKTESAVMRASDNLRMHLGNSIQDFADVVYTHQVGRRAFQYRRFVICSNGDDAVQALESLEPERVMTKRAHLTAPKIAFMFPGQGAQYVGMGAELYKTERLFRENVDYCSTQLKEEIGFDLRSRLYGGGLPSEEISRGLQDTAVAQPALFVTEYSLAKLLQSLGVHPDIMIGHSVGEYVAACIAGVVSLDDALHLVAVRGRMMQDTRAGSMLSVALSAEELRPLLTDKVNLAAINSPRQCVVSGESNLVAQLERYLTKLGVSSRQLRTGHAFHSHMMDPMLESFAREVAGVKIGKPALPYISTVTALLATEEEVNDSTHWVRQIRQTVRFAQGIQKLVEFGATLLVEVGPGRSLSTLARQCATDTRKVGVVDTMRDERMGASDAFWLMRALGKLWLAGTTVDWSALYADEKRQRVSLPSYPFERQRYWNFQSRFNPGVPNAGHPRHAEIKKTEIVDQWFYTPMWKRLGPMRDAGGGERIDGSCALVFCDRFGVGRQIAAVLALTHTEVITVGWGRKIERVAYNEYTIDPHSETDYEQLITEIVSGGKTPNHVVHLWSLISREESFCNEMIFRQAQEVGLFSLLRLLKAFKTAEVKSVRFDIVSNGLYDILGSEVLFPQNSTLLAFSKVIPQEHQHIVCRVFDIVLPPIGSRTVVELAASLAHHMSREPEELVLAFRNGDRWVQRFEGPGIKDVREVAPRLKEGGIYLITGGLGRIGLILAHYLAQKFHARLVLTGRSSFPEKDKWEAYLSDDRADNPIGNKVRALCKIERAGGEVWIKQANVACENDMKAVRAFMEEKYGKVDGVIFAAGRTTLQRSDLGDSSEKECEAHFETKVYGLMVLERVLQGVNLDFYIVLSSLSTILGGLGHLAYSAANHGADALVYRHNRSRVDLWTTANWDAWQFDGVQSGNPDMKKALTRLAMQPEEATNAFELLLRRPAVSQVIISTGQLHSRLDEWISLRSLRREGAGRNEAAHGYGRPELEVPYEEPEGDLERRVAEIWQGALGIERVGRNDDFFELGGHSLIIVQILAQVRQVFGVDFPLDRAFDAATISKAADVIDLLLKEKIERLTEAEAEELLKRDGVDLAGG